MLSSEFHKNKSGLSTHHSHQTNMGYLTQKSHDESLSVKLALEQQCGNLSTDLCGLKKSSDSKMKQLQTFKQQLHKKTDIVHMVQGELDQKGHQLDQAKMAY